MLRNCATCGRLLTLAEGVPCPFCLAEEDAAVERIRRYIEDGGAVSLGSVSRALGVPISLLNRLQAAGRIQLTGDGRRCRTCGSPLESGEVCPDCLRKFGGRAGASAGPSAPARTVGGPHAATQSRMYGRDADRPRSGR